MNQQLSALLEGLAWEEFKGAKLPERFRDKVAVVIGLRRGRQRRRRDRARARGVCGIETQILVVDDGSRDETSDAAARAGAIVARHVINRGGGAALRTGYRLMSRSGSRIVVTLDADGQHRPEEMERLVKPIVGEGRHGPRLPSARAGRPQFPLAGIRHRVLQPRRLLHHADPVSDCSNGCRAVRTTVLPPWRCARSSSTPLSS